MALESTLDDLELGISLRDEQIEVLKSFVLNCVWRINLLSDFHRYEYISLFVAHIT